jgi:hypothetical protein
MQAIDALRKQKRALEQELRQRGAFLKGWEIRGLRKLLRWLKPGAQTILNLRVLLLSGVWDEAYARVLEALEEPKTRDQCEFEEIEAQLAA